MTTEILSYRGADPRRRSARRVWAVSAIYVLPIVVPFVVWTWATWNQTPAYPSRLPRPIYFALNAAQGPITTRETWCGNMLLYDAAPWTEHHVIADPPIPAFVGVAILMFWLLIVLHIGIRRLPPMPHDIWMGLGVRQWPIWLHILFSIAWWFAGCGAVLAR